MLVFDLESNVQGRIPKEPTWEFEGQIYKNTKCHLNLVNHYKKDGNFKITLKSWCEFEDKVEAKKKAKEDKEKQEAKKKGEKKEKKVELTREEREAQEALDEKTEKFKIKSFFITTS